MSEVSYSRSVIRVSRVCIFTNIGLALMKVTAGLVGNSHALVADGVDSTADVISSLIVLVGAKIAGKASDSDHPYGHERFECVASLILANILLLVGAGIGYAAVTNIISGAYAAATLPTPLALVCAGISLAVKTALFAFTITAAKRLSSGSLRADALNYRADILASVGSLAGVLGARLGLPLLDPLVGLLMCVLIFKTAIEIYRESIDKLVDKSCDAATVSHMRAVILGQPGVDSVDLLKTRQFESRIYVDIEITADATLSLEAAHAIAERVHDAIERDFPNVKHCMVHVNPLSTALPSVPADVSGQA